MTNEYWKAMLMRALWTMLEVALGYFAGVKTFPEVDWAGLFMAVVVAALASLVKSWKVGMPEIKKETPDENDSI